MIAQANAICAQRNRELRASTPRGAGLREIVHTASRRAAIQRNALGALKQLTPPPSLAGLWQTVLAATAKAVRSTEKLASYSGAKSGADVLRQMALVNRPQLHLLVTATHAGLKQCAVVAGPSLLAP